MNSIKKWIQIMIYHLSECMMPLIPVVMAGSFLKLICMVMDLSGAAFGQTMEIFTIMADAPFYFLPILVAVSASRHFQVNPYYGAGIMGVLMMPGFTALMEGTEPVRFLMLPVVQTNYAYGVLPPILLVWLISKLEPWIDRVIPKQAKDILYPLAMFLVFAPIGMLVTGPLGALLGKGLAQILELFPAQLGFLSWGILAGLLPLLVPAGMHWIFVTTAITQISSQGMDNGIMGSFLAFMFALVGADFASALFRKDRQEKAQAAATGVVGFLTGVSEPSLFGICLKERPALVGTMIGSAVGGVLQGIFIIHTYVFAFPSAISILMFHSPENPKNLFWALLVAGTALIVGFGAACILYRAERRKSYQRD